jgi:hypothetical protein
VTVTADALTIDGSMTPDLFTGLSSEAADGTGDAGEITVRAGKLQIFGSGEISADTLTSGRGGSVDVTANTITIDGSATPGFTTGVSSASLGTGNAGQLKVASSVLVVNAGELSANTSGPGHGGSVTVAADQVQITDGGRISAQSTGAGGGDAGTVSLFGSDRVEVRDASIATGADSANGGNVVIQASTFLYLLNGGITANVPNGTGGNITIDPLYLILNHGNILADGAPGRGGKVEITAENIVSSADSEIFGTAGVEFHGALADVVGTLNPLSVDYLDAAALIRERCATRHSAEAVGSFVVRDRDGAPPSPDGLLPAPMVETASPVASLLEPGIAREPFLAGANLFASTCP